MKCLIVYTPFSGKQKFIENKDYVCKRLRERYETVDIFRSIAQRSITSYVTSFGMFYDTIVACGGDGTLNEVINGLMGISEEKRPTLAYIPSGTVNDVGHLLKIKNRSIKKMIDLILYGQCEKMDVCKLRDHHFIYAAGVGKFTNVSYDAPRGLKKRFGRMAYFLEGLKSITEDETIEMEITLDDGRVINGNYYVILALNSKRIAGFRLYRRRPPKLNDGVIDLTLLDSSRFHLGFINLGAFFLFGDFWRSGVTTVSCKSVRLKSRNELSYNLDGEFACKSDDVTIEVLKCAIKIMVHPKAKKRYF